MTAKAKKAQKSTSSSWPVKAAAPPKIANRQWALPNFVGLVLLLMAVLQLVSFSDFKDVLESSGLASAGTWAAVIILAELWGSVGFFKIPLSTGFRTMSYGLAVLVSGFWFVNSLQLLSSGIGEQMTNIGFFGRFMAQEPSWWTVTEAGLLLFAVVHCVGLLRDSRQTTRK